MSPLSAADFNTQTLFDQDDALVLNVQSVIAVRQMEGALRA